MEPANSDRKFRLHHSIVNLYDMLWTGRYYTVSGLVRMTGINVNLIRDALRQLECAGLVGVVGKWPARFFKVVL